jgi:23S rRNA pseudouridine2605 synthase
MKQMVRRGIELEDGPVKFEKISDEGGEGFNHWYRIVVTEGRNRVVRRTFEALGLPVSRLMRVRFGIVNLPSRLKRGMQAELDEGEVRRVLEWAGLEVASQAADENHKKSPGHPKTGGAAGRAMSRPRDYRKTRTGAKH